MSEDPRRGISIVVLTWNKKEVLARCLRSLEETLGGRPGIERIVIDNGSSDGTAELVTERFPGFRVVRIPQNAGVSAGLNAGFAASSTGSKYVVILNNDLEFFGDWLEILMAPAEKDPSVAVVGCKLLYPDGRIQHAGGDLSPELRTSHIGRGQTDRGQFDAVSEMPFVTGAVMLLRRSVFASIGGFDTGYTPYLFEDVDLFIRARRAGFKIMYTGKTRILHYEGATVDEDARPSVLAASFRNHLRFAMLNFSARRTARAFLIVLPRDLVFMLRKGMVPVLLGAWMETLRGSLSILSKRKAGAARWPLLD